MLQGKHVVLGVTGGIAAYKAAALASALVKLHAAVEVVMTENATKFITPLTFEQLTGLIDKHMGKLGFACKERSNSLGHYIAPESELVSTLMDVYGALSGDRESKPISIGGGTYPKSLPNILAFGPIFPGDEVREHKPDEFIEIPKLMKNAQIIASAMYEMAK